MGRTNGAGEWLQPPFLGQTVAIITRFSAVAIAVGGPKAAGNPCSRSAARPAKRGDADVVADFQVATQVKSDTRSMSGRGARNRRLT